MPPLMKHHISGTIKKKKYVYWHSFTGGGKASKKKTNIGGAHGTPPVG